MGGNQEHTITAPNRAWVVACLILGGVETAIGILAAYYGPLEVFPFYLFSTGGPFHYPGFGHGSVWFAFLALQQAAYYLLAAVLLPVGLGTLWRQRWALRLTEIFTWVWLLAGLWLTLFLFLALPYFSLILPQFSASSTQSAVAVIILVAGLVAAPVLLLPLLASESVQSVLARPSSFANWLDRRKTPRLLTLLGFVLGVMGLHFLLLLQARFPFFGQVFSQRTGVEILSGAIVVCYALIAGLAFDKIWAVWGAILVLIFGLGAIFCDFFFAPMSQLASMTLPEPERAYLAPLVPLFDSAAFSIWLAWPLVTMLALVSRRQFANRVQ